LELIARETLLLQDSRDLNRTAEAIAEVAAHAKSPEHLEALSALLYIAATFTEERFEQEQRIGWDRFFREGSEAVFGSAAIPAPVKGAMAATTDAYKIRTDKLSRLLQEADAQWMAEGPKTVAPEHQVDSFIGLAGRRYFLETARIIRFIASEDQVAAIEAMATRLAGFDLRLP
jgi:hypothetical protein